MESLMSYQSFGCFSKIGVLSVFLIDQLHEDKKSMDERKKREDIHYLGITRAVNYLKDN